MSRRHRIPRTLLTITLLVSACSTEAPLAVPDSSPSTEPQIVASDCEADALVCDDAIPSDGDPTGMPANGGITVSEALSTTATGILAIQGFLFDDGTGPRLCEALAESFPPQCGGASIPVSGHVGTTSIPLVSEQNVTWTDQAVTLFGEIIDGTLVVDPTATG